MGNLKSSVRYRARSGDVAYDSQYGEFNAWEELEAAYPSVQYDIDERYAYVSCDRCQCQNIMVPISEYPRAKTQAGALDVVLCERGSRYRRSGDMTVSCAECADGVFHWDRFYREKSDADHEQFCVVASICRNLTSAIRRRVANAPPIGVRPGRDLVFFDRDSGRNYSIVEVVTRGMEDVAEEIARSRLASVRIELGTFGDWSTWMRPRSAGNHIVTAYFDSPNVGSVHQARFDLGKGIWLDEHPLEEEHRQALVRAITEYV